jgi:hypothetical protein
MRRGKNTLVWIRNEILKRIRSQCGLALDGVWVGNQFTGLSNIERDYTLHFTIRHNSVRSHVFASLAW